ncbi:hypothetical protein FA13DRAFT_1725615 [Coprinellus micaceus]|uniref:Uncharacterized protein n=1 Tax=Coprinellus micaceus TaxID=71717 RepID=A0A4Y7TVI0_COPMI|nr:hypothetical protein FA13DRAFT_1725615 [Coprinellus micaceus]
MTVNVADFASTNRPPTDSELEELKEILAPDELVVANIEREIKAHREEVDRLVKERDELLRKMRPARLAASWIRRLPAEIMGNIFFHARAPSDCYASFRTGDAPLVLLRVCRLWRDIALNTPTLWASMDITIPSTVEGPDSRPGQEGNRKEESFENEVGRWLERSADLPLTIRIRRGYPMSMVPALSAGMGALHKTILRLAEHSHRWENLDFEGTPEMLEVLQKDLPVPRLKTWATRPSSKKPPSIFDCKSPFHSPLLQRLIIFSDLDSPEIVRKMPVKWESLTALTILNERDFQPRAGFGAQAGTQDRESFALGLLPVLERCTNLRQCLFSFPNGIVTTDGAKFVTLPALRALSLRGCCNQMNLFLTRINLPAIRELHYFPSYGTTPHVTTSFANLLLTHGDQMRVLAFDFPAISSDKFLDCLRSVPFVIQLSVGPQTEGGIHGSRRYTFEDPSDAPFILTDSHILALTPKRGDTSICPKLELFRCSYKAKVTTRIIKGFLGAKVDPDILEATGASRLRGLFITRLPGDWPFSPSRPPWGEGLRRLAEIESLDDFKAFKDAGVVVNLLRPIALNSTFHMSPIRWGYSRYSRETNFKE